MQDLQRAVNAAHAHATKGLGSGRLASYIPQLQHADPRQLAVVVADLQGGLYSCGDDAHRFTMQSIVKIILLALALQTAGAKAVFQRVGMEPTGDPFNSIVRLETVNPNKPLNPMINAGAIAVTSCIKGKTAEERFALVLQYARLLTGNPALVYDEKTFLSESDFGDRNRALAYMMRSADVIDGSVSEHLEVYFKACSLLVNCREIATLGAVLANNGISPLTGQPLLDAYHAKIIRCLMATCGMYDASGEFALRVGIPAKSGVGGGIAAAVPGRMGIGVFSPMLDGKGNSHCGLMAMESLSQQLQLSIF